MIQSMLNLTRIESGTLNLPKAEFNITDTVVRTLLLFENSIDQKHLEVECKAEEPYKINGNADYIQQVIYNIIENAVKFINEGGQLTVTVAADPDDDYYVNVSVRNTGEGLSTDEIPRIFERFYKTDQSRSKDKTGLGLGLTICKRIVHLHDGRILVRSVQGKYTEFVIQLPQIKKNRQTDRKHSEEN
jgi:signal transduction histidine kinase